MAFLSIFFYREDFIERIIKNFYTFLKYFYLHIPFFFKNEPIIIYTFLKSSLSINNKGALLLSGLEFLVGTTNDFVRLRLGEICKTNSLLFHESNYLQVRLSKGRARDRTRPDRGKPLSYPHMCGPGLSEQKPSSFTAGL